MLFFSDDVEKRSYSSLRQVCQDVMKEEVVRTSTLMNTPGNFFPETITTLRCITENRHASGVSDSSIICKTKEREINVVEADENGIPIDLPKVKVPMDCVAYRI